MRAITPLILIIAAVLTGCANGGADKAGGKRAPQATVLTFANGNGDTDELQGYAKAVERLSGGTLRIVFKDDWRAGETAFEAGVIRDVRDGKADLGWAGTRAFDDVGVKSFDALHAPLLINSYDLERAVLTGPLPARMLAGLEPAHLVGLGVLPGPLRKLLDASPVRRPADLKGQSIAFQRSQVAAATLRALGAKPDAIHPGEPIQGDDGVEQQLNSAEGNGYDQVASHVTTNLNLWPRPPVLFANPDAYAELDDRQQRALRDAVAVASEPTLTVVQRGDDDAMAILCRRGIQTHVASTADLAALRAAVQPVYDRLETDATTKAAIAAIRAQARKLHVPPDQPRCGTKATKANGPTPIDGRYTLDTTAREVAKASGETVAEGFSENYGHWTFALSHGQMRYTQASEGHRRWVRARYTVSGDRFTYTVTANGGDAPNGAAERPGETFDFTWSLYHGRLKLGVVPNKISPPGFRIHSWRPAG